MYAIGYVIYGIPLTTSLLKQIKELSYTKLPELHDELNQDDEPDLVKEIAVERYFETVYHGSAPDYVGWCGVKLSEFDEGFEELKVSSLMKQPTQKQLDEAKEKLDALPAAIKALIPNPDLYIVWGSS